MNRRSNLIEYDKKIGPGWWVYFTPLEKNPFRVLRYYVFVAVKILYKELC